MGYWNDRMRVMSDLQGWQPGSWGKGNVYPDGSVEHWVTDRRDAPHHVDQAGGDLVGLKRFDISPEGVIYPVVDGIDQRWSGQDWVKAMSAHPNFQGEGQEKAEGYGHGPKIAMADEFNLKDHIQQMFSDPYQCGLCDAYAVGLQQEYPHLRIGVAGYKQEDGGWLPQHFFAHDDTHAYDSLGKHPLPYHGIHNQFDHLELNQNAHDWGLPENGGPEDVVRAREHARNLFGDPPM